MKIKIKTSFQKFFAMTSIVAAGVLPVFPQQNPVGEFAGQTDIGAPKLSGAASYDAVNQQYTIAGAGTNMWFTSDQCHFVWKKMTGDFILRTRVEFIGKGVIEHRKIGWLVRPNLDADAPYADCAEHGSGLTSLQFRRSKGTNTEQITLAITNADVLQFERKGNTYIFSAAHFGEPFVSAALTNLDLGAEVYAGLFVCSHSGDVIEKAIFRDVRMICPAKENFVPYKDYIGSVLEILDVHSGTLEKIHESAQPFEAPNWTTDGSALIYNVSGRAEGWGKLNRFDLATKIPSLINTEPNTKNNNDHVLSFDGTMLGISDQSAGHGGASRIFTVPVGGGTPKQITSNTPSYLHGWSPDGKWLVFTGGRSNKFDIYKIASDGSGEEIRLTDSVGLNDGPEFTPEGNYIYFNSSRTGKMQIWRMKPDGSAPEQITNDQYNNWFPHISPDGKWTVIISFPEDINPAEHPYYKQCYLRLLPIEGGAPKVIAYVYGGQGTINVPSWSPDSRRIAFVSNTDLTK
jgi:Tol biopolymer transport system component